MSRAVWEWCVGRIASVMRAAFGLQLLCQHCLDPIRPLSEDAYIDVIGDQHCHDTVPQLRHKPMPQI